MTSQDWLSTNSFDNPRWTISELIAAKRGRKISVVLPALNEAETVGDVVRSIRPIVGSLVDELIVLDSGSTDTTARMATLAGATVVSREQALPDLPPVPGKGEALWRSLAVATGDIIVFVDSDLISPDPAFVPKLLGPLLLGEGFALVKGYYRRPITYGETVDENGGGRVTELVARPLIAALRPDLATVLQPLSGEYAGTREFLASVPFAPGYGVEMGLLLDVYHRLGMSALAQVNLGTRQHRNRGLADLAVMSRQIVGTVLKRCDIADSSAPLTQFPFDHGHFVPRQTAVSLADRPPMDEVRPRG